MSQGSCTSVRPITRPLALVTGAAKRVGRASALALARAGSDVMFTWHRRQSEAESTRGELLAAGASELRSVCSPLNLADLDEVESFASRLADTLASLDFLVLNASAYEPSPLATLTGSDLLHAYTVNAASNAILASRLAPLLSRSTRPGGGSIVAMADIHALGEHGVPRSRDFLAYAMSKAALAEMVRTLARELAPRVRVNAVAPGVVAWPESGHESDAATQQAYLSKVPLARAGTTEEAAEAVRWLAMDATYTTGQIIRIDGGRSMV